MPPRASLGGHGKTRLLRSAPQRLLDAGLKLFANRDYVLAPPSRTSREEAKVTKPTLYYYFENKEGLFQALVDQAMDERLHLMRQAAPPEKPTVDQLHYDAIRGHLTGLRAAASLDLLRLTFAIAFAADGAYPSGFQEAPPRCASLVSIRAQKSPRRCLRIAGVS